ncbi:riboflavin kinase [Neobacillus sp. 114]|uniref:riboflavin kinase n=1 Tax=Neobacillus sp. 114 TaxID=3048535 RepID=UPI0024C2E39D|nr:riboflavin kinase [Neobacillus sp. 114]
MVENFIPNFFEGRVIHGRKIGRTIGFPTANLHLNQELEKQFLKGVYGVEVYHKGSIYHGVMNIGVRPTFKDIKPSISVEVHILDFKQDIYGDCIGIEVVCFIREEVPFKSKDQLIQQLNKDIEQAWKMCQVRGKFIKKPVLKNNVTYI